MKQETITLYDESGAPIIVNKSDKAQYEKLGFVEAQPERKKKEKKE